MAHLRDLEALHHSMMATLDATLRDERNKFSEDCVHWWIAPDPSIVYRSFVLYAIWRLSDTKRILCAECFSGKKELDAALRLAEESEAVERWRDASSADLPPWYSLCIPCAERIAEG